MIYRRRRFWAGYSKILAIQTGIQYRSVRGNRINATEYELDDSQKERLERVLEEAFAEELTRSQYFEFTEEPGPNVVILKAGLIDVVSHVPEDKYNTKTFIQTIGEATLVIELQDSISGETLLRATERRKAENDIRLERSSSPTNLAEIRRDARRWARSLRESLDALHED